MEILKDSLVMGFACQQCGLCCKGSSIRLSPYDIMKICSNQKITSSEFLKKYSYLWLDEENEQFLTCMLKTTPACHFLDDKKCTVYADRPSGCRTFPLGAKSFYNGKVFKQEYEVLEKCGGFNASIKNTVGEFKQEQGIYSDDLLAPWAIFRVEVLNTNVPNTPEYYQKFLAICYDFDSSLFQRLLFQNKITWPEGIKERYYLIIDLALQVLVRPYSAKFK